MDTDKAVVVGSSSTECQMWYQSPESVIDASVIDPAHLPAHDNVRLTVSRGCVPAEILPVLKSQAVELMRSEALRSLPRRVDDGAD